MYRHSSLLIVDDNEINRDLLSHRLRNEGYTLAMADHGHQALDMMQVERFDMVLLDLMMPGMDGFEVLERIMSTPTIRDTPVIVLTAENDKNSVLRCIQSGAKDYIVKPFEMAVVKTRIWRCLESQRLGGRQHEVYSDNAHTGAQVLVVDDDDLNRELLGARLRHAGYDPTCVASPHEALDRLHSGTFDLILLDIMMPGIDGYQLLATIKADEEWRNIPVVMASALDNSDAISRCLDLGATDYITKPYNAVEMKARLTPCIRLKRLQDQEAARVRRYSELANIGRSLK